jgi:hypothetical protein
MGRIVGELALWLGLALVAFALTFEFAGEVGTYAWGAASWPRGVVLLMAIVALAQFAIRRRGLKLRRSAGIEGRAADADLSSEVLPRDALARLRLAAALGLPLVYVYLLPLTGFYATTPVFLLAYLLVLGERRPGALIGAPLVIYAAINLVFTRLFYVALPTGNWPGFYDFSNWFLITVR